MKRSVNAPAFLPCRRASDKLSNPISAAGGIAVCPATANSITRSGGMLRAE